MIANIGQVDFAIAAIDKLAKYANYCNMKDLRLEQQRWLGEQLMRRGRGARSALANHLGIRNDAVSRMTNLDGGKEGREISLSELIGMAEFFEEEPPGLKAARARTRDLRDRVEAKITRVPLVDMVPAGKLTAPMSQIPVDQVPLLAFADLGKGDFIALTVKGDSMDRISPDQSTIIVNKADRTLVSNKAYVFSDRGEVTFKLWKADPPQLAPYSINPMHEPRYLRSRSEGEKMVIGRVKRTVLDL